MALPTTISYAALSFKREYEIGGPLETDPDGFGAREAIAFEVEETTEASDHAHHGVE